MSARMKKHHTSDSSILYVVDKNDVYAIPEAVAKQYKLDTKQAVRREANVKAEDFFRDFVEETSEAACLLRGLRSRENLSQVEFAKKVGMTQANLSKMERGRRPIGKIIAKRIAKVFDVDYRYFLE